jgi:hypothetical protein
MFALRTILKMKEVKALLAQATALKAGIHLLAVHLKHFTNPVMQIPWAKFAIVLGRYLVFR